jgi:hypothetical protein
VKVPVVLLAETTTSRFPSPLKSPLAIPLSCEPAPKDLGAGPKDAFAHPAHEAEGVIVTLVEADAEAHPPTMATTR